MNGNESLFQQIPDNTTDCLDRPDNRFKASNLPFVIVDILLVFFICFGNVLVMVAVYKFQELRTATNIFVASLSIADLLMGAVALPLHILLFLVPSLKAYFTLCLLRYTILVVSSGSSGLTLMLIAIDRYVAIHKPYQYPNILSISKSISLCGLTWCFYLVYGSLPFVGLNTWERCQDCTLTLVLPSSYIRGGPCQTFIVLVVMAVLYGRVFMTANDMAKEIHRQTVSVDTEDGRRQRNEKKLFMQNTKAAKTLGTVVGWFAFCNVPFAIFTLWEISTLDKLKPMPPWMNWIRISTGILVLLNSGINPIIYHKRLPQFRKSFLKLLRINSSTVDTQSD